MKNYCKIPSSFEIMMDKFIAFEKYDGTCLVAEHDLENPKNFMYGTRSDYPLHDYFFKSEFSNIHPEIKWAGDYIWEYLKNYGDLILTRLQKCNLNHYDNVRFVFEYFGKDSFAGQHNPRSSHDVVLIDLILLKNQEEKILETYLSPDIFVNVAKDCRSARVIYQGKFNGSFVEDVRKGNFDVVEGVVCKGYGKYQSVCKVKTNSYMEKLKNHFKDDWKGYWE